LDKRTNPASALQGDYPGVAAEAIVAFIKKESYLEVYAPCWIGAPLSALVPKKPKLRKAAEAALPPCVHGDCGSLTQAKSLEKRNNYMAALEPTSANQGITPFAKFLAHLTVIK
jgi:hypothetical protein